MRKFSMENLLSKDIKLVERKKLIILIPCAVIIIGLIMMGIFAGTLGSPINLGMDFTGGYTVQIKAGSKINEENFDEHKATVTEFMQNYTFESNGKEYKVRFDSNNGIKRLGSKVDTSMRIEFRAPANFSKNEIDDLMDDLRKDLASELNKLVGFEAPHISIDESNKVSAKYSMAVLSYVSEDGVKGIFADQLSAAGISFKDKLVVTDENGKDEGIFNTLSFELNGTATKEELKEALTIEDPYSAKAIATDMIGGSVSSDLIIKAITAVLIALVLMLFYIIIRFEFASGVASVIALIHDIVIMFMFMIIFRIEFNATFIAGLITILGYSINNSIIVFDRVRENMKTMPAKDKNVTSAQIANRSVVETLGRSINTTLTTLIMILSVVVVCAIGGIADMVTFGLPIIIGLGAGLFSSTLVAPMIWSLIRKRNLATRKPIFKKPVKESITVTAAPPSEEA